jgi:hypothetical protein
MLPNGRGITTHQKTNTIIQNENGHPKMTIQLNVPRTGVEPALLTERAPKTRASANFAIWAINSFFLRK